MTTPPKLHIGLLNMMADGALRATERQFQGLLGPGCELHPFSFPEIPRGTAGRSYVSANYADFAAVAARGLDALIITGANIATPDLSLQPFWDPLQQVMAWARDNVRSTLCSCLATHAVLEARYGQQRRRMPAKLWGVYDHRISEDEHPLVRGLGASVPVPHSRHNEITPQQFEAAGLTVLLQGDQGGVHLAAGDGLVLLQGHPEYDDVSLLKEYRRETERWFAGDREDYPPLLTGTLDAAGRTVCREHDQEVRSSRAAGTPPPEFPEAALVARVRGGWHAPAAAVMTNWIRGLARPR